MAGVLQGMVYCTGSFPPESWLDVLKQTCWWSEKILSQACLCL